MPEPNNKYQENLRLLNDPRIQSLLKTIRSAEGATYNTRVGGSTFDDLSKKPGVMTKLTKLGIKSSAEGAYQFLNKTWDNVSKDLGLKDFSPLSQDIAAVELIKRRGALDNILRGDFKGGINKLSPEWASLPTASGKGYYSGQKARRIDDLEKIYTGKKVPTGTYESFTSPTTYSHSKNIDLDSNPIDLESSTVEYEEPEVIEAKQDITEKSFQEDLSKLMLVQQSQEPVQPIQQISEFTPSDLQDPYNYIQEDPGYNFEQFQNGGEFFPQLEKRNNTYYDLPINNPDIIEPENFTEDYIKSTKYKERLINSGYKNPDLVIKNRLNKVDSVKTILQDGKPNILEQTWLKLNDKPYSTSGSAYFPEYNTIVMDNEDKNKKMLKGLDLDSIKSHEFGHVEIAGSKLNKRDEDELFNRQKEFQLGKFEEILTLKEREDIKSKGRRTNYSSIGHDFRPEENKSDLNALRYMLKRENIYDAGKETFNKEHLKKLKSNFFKERLLKNYKEEDLIWLMNNVAENDRDENKVYAQEGGSVETSKDFLQNWYKDRVLPDPVLNEAYKKEKNLYIESSQNLPDPTYTDKIDDDNTQGTYDSQTGQINLLKTATPLVYTHEGTHKVNLPLKDTQSNVNAFGIIGENILPQDKIQNQWVKDNYEQISNYQEVIPRLNSYRQLHGLKPDQVITPELIQNNRDLYSQGKIPFEDNTDQLYKMFENEGLSNVLNKVVTNDNSGTNYFAQNGGFVPVSENGMYEYPNQKVLVPTSGSITMKKIEHPILGISQETGEQIMMQPENEYFFKNTKNVLEIPIKNKKINNRFK